MKNFYLFFSEAIINILVRLFIQNSEIKDGLTDIAGYLGSLGFDSVDSMEFETGIKCLIPKIAKELRDSKILDRFPDETKKRIIEAASNDINRWVSINYNNINSIILDEIDIDKEIKIPSSLERTTWSEEEIGAYNNCIRFATGIIRKSIITDKSFTAESLISLNANMADFERVVINEIKSIRHIIEKGLMGSDKNKNYETDYLLKVKSKNEKITLFGSGINEKKYNTYNVEPSYVELFCIREEEAKEQSDNFGLNNLLERENVVWLKGEAGGGKTTFIKWIAVRAASDLKITNSSIGGLVPIVIKLREVEFPINYEKEISKVTAKIGIDCPEGYFSSLVKNDKLLLLFDGLDEVSLDAQREIMECVDDLYQTLLYNAKKRQQRSFNSKIIITSRPYVEDELECNHGKYMINRMKAPQVKKLVYFWHKAVFANDYSEEELKIKAESVLSVINNSQGIRSIAGTPLLCAMICALYYYNNGKVPEKRGELYEQCCKMLVYSRDAERKIEDSRFNYLEYTTVVTIIQDIAVYMLRSGKTEVDKKYLLEHMKAIYKDRTLISEVKDRNNPGPLLDYLIKRTGIIREPSKGRVDFIHKTFLEFLAAESLKNSSSWEEVEKNVTDEFWKETIIMCFWRTNCDKASSMLKKFIEMYEKTSNEEVIFMASMCANSATDIDTALQLEIERYLSKLIPPTKANALKLCHVGAYVLPFLANKSSFDEQEKYNCIYTLSHIPHEDINSDEYLRVVSTYLKPSETYDIKAAAWDCIVEMPMEVLIENEIESVLYNAFFSNSEGVARIPSSVLRVIAETKKKLTLRKLIIDIDYFSGPFFVDDVEKEFKLCNTIFENVMEVVLHRVNSISEVKWIDDIKGVKKLTLYINNDSDAIISCLGGMKIAKNLERLKYSSRNLRYISDSDINRFTNLQQLTLQLYSKNLEFCLDSFAKTPKLSKVIIDLNPRVRADMYYPIMDLKDKYKDINIILK